MIYGNNIFLDEYNYKNIVSESILALLYPEDSSINEGANIDMTKAFKDITKEYKYHIKASKKYLKNKEYDEAINEAKKAKASVKKLENKIRSIDASNKSSVAFGFLIGTFITFIQYFTVSFGVYGSSRVSKTVYRSMKLGQKVTKKAIKDSLGYAPWLSLIFASIFTIYSNIIEIRDRYGEAIHNGTPKEEAYNLYKTKLLDMINKFYVNIDKVVAKIIDHEQRDELERIKKKEK